MDYTPCPSYDPETCPVPVQIPWTGNEETVDRCLLAELQKLWAQGICTETSSCGDGNASVAYIAVNELYIDRMIELGYVENPDAPCFIIGGKAFKPKSKCPKKKR